MRVAQAFRILMNEGRVRVSDPVLESILVERVLEKDRIAIPVSGEVILLPDDLVEAVEILIDQIETDCCRTEDIDQLYNSIASRYPGFERSSLMNLLYLILGEYPIECMGGFVVLERRALFSNLTGSNYYEGDQNVVMIRMGRHHWEPCYESEAELFGFYCHATEQWYSYNHDCVIVDGRTYLFSAVEDSIYLWSDGTFHWEPETNLGLSEYHRGYRPAWEDGKRLSFELEIEVGDPDSDFGDRVRRIWHAAEKDASLGVLGAELIIGFVPLPKVEESLQEICKLLQQYKCHVPDDYYGFHVSASVSGWKLGERELKRLSSAFYDNIDLILEIARRPDNRYCRLCLEDKNQVPTIDKYAALRLDGDRLEFRIFKASVDFTELRRCALLVEALLEFSISNSENFMSFLQVNYRELANVLHRLCA